MKTASHVSKGGTVAPKEERCKLAGCPLAGLHDCRCERCSGPVTWTDADGVRHGCARRCSSCKMNGLGLPVCWAACPGPNDDFQTDGKSMVTLGGMADPDGFIASRSCAGELVADGFCGDGDETGDGRNPLVVLLASRMLLLSGKAWDEWRSACAAMDAERAGRVAGAPQGAFRGPGGSWEGSAADRIMERLCGLDAANWEAVRRLAIGDAQKRVADLTGVRKQAMNQRLKRLVGKSGWVAELARKDL